MNSNSLYLVIALLLAIIVFMGSQLVRQSQTQSVVINESVDEVEPLPEVEVAPESGHYHDENGNHVDHEGNLLITEGQVGELAYGNAEITADDTYRYISSNGIPLHETGQFPNPGNPNSISEQDIFYRVPLSPKYTGDQTPAQVPGVALNGIPMEPATAERENGYNIEALQDTYNLGLDVNNAHVQPSGLYHYHGVPEGYIETVLESSDAPNPDLIHIGWAADGFAMYHSLSHAYTSGYELKTQRDDGSIPDGTYTQDFEFTGSGTLDECNGVWIDGVTYAYFLTDEFPYIPRCLNGVPDESFAKGPGAGVPPSGEGADGSLPTDKAAGSQGNPPAEAIAACSGKSTGSSCLVTTPHGQLSGSCMTPPSLTQLACVPN